MAQSKSKTNKDPLPRVGLVYEGLTYGVPDGLATHATVKFEHDGKFVETPLRTFLLGLAETLAAL